MLTIQTFTLPDGKYVILKEPSKQALIYKLSLETGEWEPVRELLFGSWSREYIGNIGQITIE